MDRVHFAAVQDNLSATLCIYLNSDIRPACFDIGRTVILQGMGK